MMEAVVSSIISLVVFAVGYGRLHEKIASLEKDRDEAERKIDGIHAINVTLAEMKMDIHFIKEKLKD